jgi:DNA-3-methyladenine glycosylase
MKPLRLRREFFLQPTLDVSKALLGKYLVHEYKGQKLVGMIVETEAYIGHRDRAAHSYGGRRTRRNEVEYGPGGHVYIYMVYGLHYQLNFVTAGKDSPECVLIRALEPVAGLETMKKLRHSGNLRNLTNGPGKLCQALHLDKTLYGVDLCAPGSKFFLEDRDVKLVSGRIKKGPRIGIDYAGPYWSKVNWRFWVRDNPFVSKQ